MFFLFFFFKQKTAYEMRISDWSSDVCSSDLLHPSRHSVVDGYAAVTRGQSVPVRATCAHPTQSKQRRATMKRSTPFLALGLWVAALGFAAGVQAGEIGRASGRERVCQYV